MFFGREAEVERVEALLDGARTGSGATLVLEGDPGIGKTTLLDEAIERAAGINHRRITGLEAESHLAFAALAEIAEPLLDGLSGLPAPQARAIEAALALAPPAAGDRFAACAGFLGLLTTAAAERPVLLAIDDAQWLDRASAECLGYAARRLAGRSIAFLAAARCGSQHPFTGRTVTRIELGGLDDRAARALLEERGGRFPAATSEALLAAAAGNPMALVEMPSLLTDAQRSGAEPLEDPLPPGIGIQRAFESRIAGLPDPARDACVVAAVALAPDLGPINAACRSLGLDPAALEEAESAGIVRLTPEHLRFEHPLLRSTVHAGAEAAERRRAHLALAEHTGADSSAWHRAAAAVGPDTAVADALEAVAKRAADRGAHAPAADAYERSARLSDQPGERTRRLVAAGVAAAIGGAYDRGAELLELADEIDDPEVRALLRHRLALVNLSGGLHSATELQALLVETAEQVEPSDAAAAAGMHADAGVAAAVAGDCRSVLEAGERATALLPADAPTAARCQVLSVKGLGLVLRGRGEEARAALDRAGELLPELDRLSPAAQSIALALGGRRSTGQVAVLRSEVESFEEAARGAGALGMFPYLQILIADCAYRMGDWDVAATMIADGIAGAEESAQRSSLSIGLAIAARLHAARGEEREAREAVEQAQEIAATAALGSAMGWCNAAIGFLELSTGNVAAAVAELEPLERVFALGGLDDPLLVPSAPDLIEAYIGAGRSGDAEIASAELTGRAERNATAGAAALAARCRGLVASGAFDRHFEQAIELHDEDGAPFELARTLLCYGARLHRARRRPAAREHLRDAEAIFSRLGAVPWKERAEAELRAAGAVKRRPAANPDELTAQELRVALRVADGATNREVAAELFLSPKTIEFHLGRVYRKLDIHSRTELAGAVAAGRLDPPE